MLKKMVFRQLSPSINTKVKSSYNTIMKKEYLTPTTKVVLIKGQHSLLAASPSGIDATASGYSAGDDSDITQDE